MLRNIIFTMIMLGSYGMSAQNVELDKVVLEDGSSHVGKVVEQKPGAYIKLALENSQDTLTFTMDEIQRLMKVTMQAPEVMPDQKDNKDRAFNTHAFSIDLSGSTGGGDVAFQGLGIGLDYRVNDRMTVGLATQYLGESGNTLRLQYQWQKLPLTAEIKYDLQRHFSGRTALYACTGLGYSFTLDDSYQSSDTGELLTITNGWTMSPGLGYRVNFLNNMGLMLDVRYVLIADKTVDEMDDVVKTNNWSNVMFSARIFF